MQTTYLIVVISLEMSITKSQPRTHNCFYMYHTSKPYVIILAFSKTTYISKASINIVNYSQEH